MIFSATRDALNPFLNTESLRNRLWVIDHYKFRYGAAHTYWVHSALQKYFSHLNKFRHKENDGYYTCNDKNRIHFVEWFRERIY